MRWLPYFILSYLAIGLQIGLAPYIAYHGAAPNLVLLVAVFIAIHAPRESALLACFALGFVQDLLSVQQPGLFALSYGLVGLFVTSTHQMVYKGHPLTHFSLVLVAGLMTASVLLVQGWIRQPAPRITTELIRVLYTAGLAPIVFAGLHRTGGLFGLHPGRRRARAW